MVVYEDFSLLFTVELRRDLNDLFNFYLKPLKEPYLVLVITILAALILMSRIIKCIIIFTSPHIF